MTLSLARRAERFPDRTAVVDVSEERLYAPAETIHEHRISYGELSAIATRTAEHLSALDVTNGDLVCFVSRNRIAGIALLFACRRLGATLAPISHLLTPASVERPFDVIDPDLLVSEAAQRDLVRSIPVDCSVTLEELAHAGRDDVDVGADSPDHDTESGPPVLFLHGEDGRPIVGYTDEALEWNCISSLVSWELSASDVVPITSRLSSPHGLVRVALSTLYVGGTLLLDRAFDPGDALTAIDAEAATVLLCREPEVHDLSAESEFGESIEPIDRLVVEGAVEEDALAAYRDRDVSIARAYGRLECPTALSQSFADSDTIDVGRPVPDGRARLIDETGSTLAGEGDGRLQLGGPIVADGYVSPDGTDDENWYDSAEIHSADYDDADGTGQFVDDWFDTDRRFRRDEAGRYRPL